MTRADARAAFEMYVSPLPLAEDLSQEEALGRYSATQPESEQLHHVVRHHREMAWKETECGLMLGQPVEVVTEHFARAAKHLDWLQTGGRVVTTFDQYAQDQLLSINLPAFRARAQLIGRLPDEGWDEIQHQTAVLLEQALGADVHASKSSHFTLPDHQPCHGTETLREAIVGRLGLMTLGLMAGHELFPSSLRESKNPPKGLGLPRRAHDFYVIRDGQKDPFASLGPSKRSHGRPEINKVSLPLLCQEVYEEDGFNIPEIESARPDENAPFPVLPVAEWITRYAQGRELDRSRTAFLDIVTDAVEAELDLTLQP